MKLKKKQMIRRHKSSKTLYAVVKEGSVYLAEKEQLLKWVQK